MTLPVEFVILTTLLFTISQRRETVGLSAGWVPAGPAAKASAGMRANRTAAMRNAFAMLPVLRVVCPGEDTPAPGARRNADAGPKAGVGESTAPRCVRPDQACGWGSRPASGSPGLPFGRLLVEGTAETFEADEVSSGFSRIGGRP